MPTSTSEVLSPVGTAADLKSWITELARAEGFDQVGFSAPDGGGPAGERLKRFLDAGWHGDMDWLARTAARRHHPGALWPGVRTIVMLGLNYGPADDPLAALGRRREGAISVYARGRDYHDVVKRRLKRIGRRIAAATGMELKVFVDTAPVLEKPLAQAAGLGWQGKHTNLVSRELGSWAFLGAIFLDRELAPDPPGTDHCGECRRCLDICPTGAFPAPYRLDARRCLSYLTIEHKGHIPAEFRQAMGNRIYGCDDCLAVCPWNKFARAAREAAFQAPAALTGPKLADLARLDDAAFRALFRGSAVKRLGRDRFVRNVLIAIGNSADPDLGAEAEARLGDASPLVRAMAVWAVARLAPADRVAGLARRQAPGETDPAVRAEWRAITPA